ncbi:MAG TPA: hypothetical protein DCX06_14360 [Opitutae bacterium]|nr:hypothetical protein [Opitutae bacterium]
MNEYLYQRQVIAYHGCDQSTVDQIIGGGDTLKPSEKNHDWLGKGIYFWEYGPERALDWQSKEKRGSSLFLVDNAFACLRVLN